MAKSKLYIKNSVPLEQAEELVIGEEYFNEDGHCIRYIGNNEFIFIKRTPLISDETLSDLNGDHVLKVFWALSRNM